MLFTQQNKTLYPPELVRILYKDKSLFNVNPETLGRSKIYDFK
jgi:hypothetical protein